MLSAGFRRCAGGAAREDRPRAETYRGSDWTAPNGAYAKLSFSMEGVSERVVPGEGYWLLSAAYLRSELCW